MLRFSFLAIIIVYSSGFLCDLFMNLSAEVGENRSNPIDIFTFAWFTRYYILDSLAIRGFSYE